MPYTVNGCGTKFYGKRDQGTDGSYVTTKWITLFYIPLIPLKSYRALPVSAQTGVLSRSQQYLVRPVSLCGKQILNCYLVAAGVVSVAAVVLAAINA